MWYKVILVLFNLGKNIFKCKLYWLLLFGLFLFVLFLFLRVILVG